MVLLFEGRFDGNLEGCGDVIEKTTHSQNQTLWVIQRTGGWRHNLDDQLGGGRWEAG